MDSVKKWRRLWAVAVWKPDVIIPPFLTGRVAEFLLQLHPRLPIFTNQWIYSRRAKNRGASFRTGRVQVMFLRRVMFFLHRRRVMFCLHRRIYTACSGLKCSAAGSSALPRPQVFLTAYRLQRAQVLRSFGRMKNKNCAHDLSKHGCGQIRFDSLRSDPV